MLTQERPIIWLSSTIIKDIALTQMLPQLAPYSGTTLQRTLILATIKISPTVEMMNNPQTGTSHIILFANLNLEFRRQKPQKKISKKDECKVCDAKSKMDCREGKKNLVSSTV
jgi:hypothetical protein